jgi:exoribonuclease-2
MLQDNPLLAQLKQQLHAQTLRFDGTVKGTDKNFGFLEVDGQKTYFIPPQYMKKVMHGDQVTAAIHIEKDREVAEPEVLIEPALTRFVGQIRHKNNKLFVIADQPNINDLIPCRPVNRLDRTFNEGDWVIAEIRQHPLKNGAYFNAEITEFITDGQDKFAPWWVTLARYQLEKQAPSIESLEMLDEGLARRDLTDLPFFTIDSQKTEDMDDALYLEEHSDGKLKLFVAIADPTAYIAENSPLDAIAQKRAFTHYLPGFEIPMLPMELSNNLCSLRPNQKRPALLCSVSVNADGSLADDIEFSACWIESKAKLAYDDVSDWLELNQHWQPNDVNIERQLRLLQRFSQSRYQWRLEHAMVFKDKPDYRFILDDQANVTTIKIEHRRTANRMIEEAMIAANMCAAKVLTEKLGFGVFNVHSGFDHTKFDQIDGILKENDIEFDVSKLTSLTGFCQLRRMLDQQTSSYLDMRTRRYQNYAETSLTPAPHFGLGLESYATWTSPIRKYGDIINHRLLKAFLTGTKAAQPDESLPPLLSERRRMTKLAEREISDWLYVRYLQSRPNSEQLYSAEIIDVTRGGARVRLLDNGAIAFIPAPLIHPVREEIICQQDKGCILLNGAGYLRQGDKVNVMITEIKQESRSIIAKLAQ